MTGIVKLFLFSLQGVYAAKMSYIIIWNQLTNYMLDDGFFKLYHCAGTSVTGTLSPELMLFSL